MTDVHKAEIDRARGAARTRFADIDETFVGGRPETADPDNPPIAEAQFAGFRPAAEVVPGLIAARLRRGDRGPQSPAPGTFSVHLDADVVEALRSSGEGWQERVNDLLRGALAIRPGAVPRNDADDTAWLKAMDDVVRRVFAGEPVAPDEIRRMAEAVQRPVEPASSGARRA